VNNGELSIIKIKELLLRDKDHMLGIIFRIIITVQDCQEGFKVAADPTGKNMEVIQRLGSNLQ
jgi:hypothetical protein